MTEVRFPKKHQTFFKTHCLDCHDTETQEGEVDLETLSFTITTIEQAERWQKVMNVLNSGEMPPEDSERPDGNEKADFLDDLAHTMVSARKSLSDSGGRITMRRLNRREYQNTIEQLLSLKVDVSSLPADGGAGAFDTVGASQFISSDQIEQYLKLGRSAIDDAFERRAATGQVAKTFRLEPEDTVNAKSRKIMAKQEKTQKRYLLWKAEVDKVAFLSENEESLAQIREKFKIDDLRNNLRLYQNTGLLKRAPDATKFGFVDGNDASFSFRVYDRSYAYMKHYLELPNSDQGTYLKTTWGIQRIDLIPDPKDVPPGTYKLRIRAGTVKGSDSSRHFIEVGHPHRIDGQPAGFSGKPLASYQVTGTEDNPEIIETTLVIGSNTPRELGVRERQPEDNKRFLRNEFAIDKQKNGYGTPPAIWVDWMELEGPITEAAATESKIIRIEPEQTINPDNEKEIVEIEDAYARFTRWQKGVDKAAATHENQARMAKFGKTEPKAAHPVWSYGFADRLEGTPNPKDFGFRDSQKAAASHPANDRANLAYHKHYAALPHRDRGTYLKLAHGTGRIIVPSKKKELPPGSYVMRVRVGAVEGTPAERRFIQVGHPQRLIESRNWGLEGPAISTHQVTGTLENPETIEIPLEITSNTIREFAVQEKQPNNGNLKALWDAHNKLKVENGYGHPPAIWIDWVELEGPLSSSHKQWKQRREVELYANAKVGGGYNGYFKGGYEKGKAFLDTGKPQKGIVDEQEAKFRIRQFEEEGPAYCRYLDDPLTQVGSFLTISNVNKEEYIALPPEQLSNWKNEHIVESLPPGTYKLRCRIGAVEGTPAERHFVDLGAVPDKEHFDRLATFQITGSTDEPEIIEVPVQLTKDSPRKFALREKRDVKADAGRDRDARKENGVGLKPVLWIDWVEWEGPLDVSNESGRRNWWITEADEPDKSLRARKMIERFALEAFRGVEPETEYIDRLTGLFAIRRKAGDSFDTAIRLPLSIILASPGFLYLNEPNDADDRRQLTDRELAVRLAYFLWSAPPDRELLELAKQQKLSQPETLRQQVDRMIADERSNEFISGFVHQWLDMERLDFFQFDTRLYRDFDESTRAAAREEVYQSFAHLFRGGEDGRISQLLKSDTVFINGLLATYYGIEGVTGDEFQEVRLPANSPRGGLLGMAAIHAMGSDGVVSSPVERGAWVLRHLLHDPPPPAPPNVPQISRLQGEILTTRERLRVHQEEAQCASCHRKIDPIGLGLENFNAAGKWRTTDSYQARDARGRGVGKKKTWDIDPSGAIYNGPSFADYFELRDIVVSRQDDFARGFTEHLIEYALGRPFGFTDEDFAEEVVQSAKIKDYAVSEFVHAVVQSKAFQSK